MEKTLRFKIDGKEYKLVFTRATVVDTENMGFNLMYISDKPMASLTYLWRGAFLANHGTLTYAEMDALLDKVKHKGLLDALLDLYNAPINSLMDEDNEKNAVGWTVD